MMQRKHSDIGVAHHEAAHAVILFRVTGHKPSSITILPDYSEGTLGSTSGADCDHDSVDDLRGEILSCFAGGDAQRKFDPATGEDGCEKDEKLAVEYLNAIGEQDSIDEYRRQSFELVEQHWAEIQAVAADLLIFKTLDAEELEYLADHALGDPTALADLQSYRVRRGRIGIH